jgi:hypothetical protein
MKLLAAPAVVLAIVLASCGDGGGGAAPPTGAAPTSTADRLETARAVEADVGPSLPGEHVDLPAIYGGPYPDTAPHVQEDVDYSQQGLPPVGGPHWGSGACGEDPSAAAAFCGPAPWGIYREPWQPETLIHNMEHAGVVVWYNTDDEATIDALEAFAVAQLQAGRMLVLAPYPEMAGDSVAITVWSRRDVMSVDDLDMGRLREFIDALYCRFDPESFCSPLD